MQKTSLSLLCMSNFLFSQNLEISGAVHASFDAVSYSNTKPQRDDLSTILSSRNSNIGLKHSQELSSTIEGFIIANEYYTGSQGEYETEGERYIGLKNKTYGTVSFGQMDSPAYKTLKKVDPLFSRIGEYKNITKGFSNLNSYMHDQPYRDTAAYSKQFLNNFQFDFSIVTDQDSEITDEHITGNTNEPHALGLSYNSLNTFLSITLTELYKNGSTDAEKSYRIGAKHSWDNFIFSGLYDHAKDYKMQTHQAYMLSATIKQDSIRYTAQINYAKNIDEDKNNGAIFQLATDFILNKGSYLYIQFAEAEIENDAYFEYGQLNYDKDVALSFGLVYKFSSEIKVVPKQ
ncbi:MAG: porin [Campylobacterota bacterium]|nr:porin [Campylobacterota bacterium]